jgi:hypothetical protein
MTEGHIETDQEYKNRTSRIDMDYIYILITLQECLNGNTNESMINESIALVKKYRENNK